MKRLLGYLLALLLLPVFVSPSASAGCSVYTGCGHTELKLAVPTRVPQGTRPVVRVQVVAQSGNAKPVGKVTVRVKGRAGGFTWSTTRFVSEGVTRTVRLPRLTKRGRYFVTARFVPQPDSVFGGDSSTKAFRVVRKP